jgi:hypothetical protein
MLVGKSCCRQKKNQPSNALSVCYQGREPTNQPPKSKSRLGPRGTIYVTTLPKKEEEVGGRRRKDLKK